MVGAVGAIDTGEFELTGPGESCPLSAVIVPCPLANFGSSSVELPDVMVIAEVRFGKVRLVTAAAFTTS